MVKRNIRSNRRNLLQVRRPPDNVFVGETRQDTFLYYFEQTCGNVTATCEFCNMDRQTFYNWMQGTRPIDLQFQERIRELRAAERYIDYAEATVLQAVKDGDVDAAKFVLKTRGKHRGWTERLEFADAHLDLIDKVANAYRRWLADNPDVSPEDKKLWLVRFAERAQVDADQLAKKVGIE